MYHSHNIELNLSECKILPISSSYSYSKEVDEEKVVIKSVKVFLVAGKSKTSIEYIEQDYYSNKDIVVATL